jgi:lipid II:glycine glycyltransferase (peptidoglycan interpeptide bridge formation enzyme)
MGEENLRLAVTSSQLSSEDEDFLAAKSNILATAFLVKRSVKGIDYYFVPYGPVLGKIKRKAAFSLLLSKITSLAKENGVAFLRLEPKIPLDNYLTIAPVDDTAQAQDTLVMDISKDKRELLANMKSKWRYNIRLAKKKGVKIKQAETVEEIDEFWRLLKQNSIDNDFSIHSKQYYSKQLEVLSSYNMEELLLAKKDGKIIAANLVAYYGPTSYYLHGAMDRSFSKYMASHLLQWQAILRARKKDCRYYDFFGMVPKTAAKDHPWQGFSRFKKGFAPGTRVTHYPGAYFLPINQPKYFLFKSMKKIKNYFDL